MKPSIHKQVQETISRMGLGGQKMLLAVSGGMDSMVLLYVFHALKMKVEVAHVNYGFRREESAKEAALVEEMAAAWSIPLHVKNCDGYAGLEAADDHNLQLYARNVRYDFFHELLVSRGLDVIVTAHHEDDNAETILLNFVKGTGSAGLKGMPVYMDQKLKPLLSISKAELMAYAEANAIPFLNDSSNADSHYDRNFLRNAVIPLLETRFPTIKKNMAMNAKRLRGFIHFFDQMIAARLSVLIKREATRTFVFIEQLQHEIYAEEVALLLLQTYGFGHLQLQELFKLMASRNGANLASATHLLVKEANRLVIVKQELQPTLQALDTVDALLGASVVVEGVTYGFSVVDTAAVSAERSDAWFMDLDAMAFPVMIRLHQLGDYFYPLGLNKKKKISKFLIDEKVPNAARVGQYVLVSNQLIAAVIGRRIDHRFRVKAGSGRVLMISKRD